MADDQLTVEYREIEGFPGYRVGSDGSVWSRRPIDGGRDLAPVWRKMKSHETDRYVHVGLYAAGRQVTFLLHLLVLRAFVGPCPEGMQCRHLDGDPTNNRLCNLAWGTRVQNQADRLAHGTDGRGERHPAARLSEAQVRAIRQEVEADRSRGWSKRLAAKYRVTVHTIGKIASGKRWRHVV